MTFSENAQAKRRPQILDDETRGIDAREYENAWLHEDSWVSSFIARFTRLLRKVGGKN
jgi:hypothetical protein